MRPRINIIGAGRLGKTLGRLIHDTQAAIIQDICNNSMRSSIEACEFIGAGTPCSQLNNLTEADITFITVPDDQIEAVCIQFSKSTACNAKTIVLHCSGLLTSDVLAAVAAKGCPTLSCHPTHSFADPYLSVKQFFGTYCAIEGAAIAILPITEIFEKIGAKVIAINKNKKPSYHLAAIFAGNYLTTLISIALNNLKNAGIEESIAYDLLLKYLQDNVNNLKLTQSCEKALTGPIKRGDIETLTKHLAALENVDLKKLYIELAKATLGIAQHDSKKNKKILDVLDCF